MQEADELTSSPDGRWFAFHVDRTTLIILESKNCPEHVRSIENLDTAVTLESILSDLEDMGEAT